MDTRDDQFRRFMGDGADDPRPTFCVLDDGNVVGWVDFDRDEREWLTHDEVNIGYGLRRDARGKGYATRAVQLLISHLARETDVVTATLLIDPENQWSLGVAERARFGPRLDLNGQAYFKRPVPPTIYSDGVVTIRPFAMKDLDRDLSAKDEEQIRWLWLAGQREHWESMSADEQRDHARRGIEAHLADPRGGPKWSFVIDVDGEYCGHIDCDLANPGVPHGEANISYSSHPDARGKGYVSRAVRLILEFVRDHTGAREAHIGVEEGNEASLRVAQAVGAVTAGHYVDDEGKAMIRHVIRL